MEMKLQASEDFLAEVATQEVQAIHDLVALKKIDSVMNEFGE